MPDLKTSLHLNMLAASKMRKWLPIRLMAAIKREWGLRDIYGMEWGDPALVPPLEFIRKRYLDPYVRNDHVAIEIGPGGGRWTQYMLGFKKLYAVDYHAELLAELKKNFHASNMIFIKNNGTDFPDVVQGTVDYVFSFGVFIHLDTPLIEAYLKNLRPILKPGANIVLQYSDKTKIMAQLNQGFSDNTPETMRRMVQNAGYEIAEEDTTTLWHSSIIRFTPQVSVR